MSESDHGRSAAGVGSAPVAPDGPVVVIPEPVSDEGWTYDVERSILEPRGVTLVVAASEAEAKAAIRDADVVFTSSRISATDIATLRRCVGILCYSVGTDMVDAKAAAAAGIPVWNCPTSNLEEVSDFTVLLILAAQRRLLTFAAAGARGEWDVFEWPEWRAVRRMRGRTVGIVGAGRIGQMVAQKLHGFHATTIACDPFVESTADPLLQLVSLDELVARSDIIVGCAALTDTSRGMFGPELFRLARPGLIFVNVSRGGLVDEGALADALDSGQVAYAALDVRPAEPPDPAWDRLAGRPNVLLTPHVAGPSIESFRDLHVEAGTRILALLEQAGRLPAS